MALGNLSWSKSPPTLDVLHADCVGSAIRHRRRRTYASEGCAAGKSSSSSPSSWRTTKARRSPMRTVRFVRLDRDLTIRPSRRGQSLWLLSHGQQIGADPLGLSRMRSSVPAGGHRLIVFASGKNRVNPVAQRCTPAFQLEQAPANTSRLVGPGRAWSCRRSIRTRRNAATFPTAFWAAISALVTIHGAGRRLEPLMTMRYRRPRREIGVLSRFGGILHREPFTLYRFRTATRGLRYPLHD